MDIITTLPSQNLGQNNSLEQYCGPHTASSVFLILVYFDKLEDLFIYGIGQ